MSLLQLPLKRAAVQLPRASFICRRCLSSQSSRAAAPATVLISSAAPALPARTPLSSRIAQFAQSSRAFATTRVSNSAATSAAVDANVPPQAESDDAAGKSTRSSFPETSSKAAGYWLIASAASVFGIVVFGGLTRLTESGLSITEWKPVTGSLPPLSEADWNSEFDKYRASPEYKLLNPHMTLAEFKKIYYMEWTHRLWGRFIGLTFVLPTLYFVLRRRVTTRLAWQLGGISALIGFQGAIGWWMVKSGLRDDLFEPGSHPRVSQYRLAAHLATAFVCYSWMLVAGLSVLRTHKLLALPAATAAQSVAALQNPALAPFRRYATALTGLIFLTSMSGALVAGLDAGLIYNDFPWMGTGLTPPKAELWSPFYCRREDGSDLWWRNMLENPSLVQLDHRILATTTFCAVLALFAYSRRGQLAAAVPKNVRKGMMGVVHLVLLQVTLGICTLWYLVPTHLAATHQAGSLALLSGALVLAHRLRVPKSTQLLIQRRLKAAASSPGHVILTPIQHLKTPPKL